MKMMKKKQTTLEQLRVLSNLTMTEIAEKLCYYDTRNPDGVKSYMTEEEIKEEGYTATSKHDCSCDNCFYGRTKLALYILKLSNAMPMGIILPD
jgi:hypothetical protein